MLYHAGQPTQHTTDWAILALSGYSWTWLLLWNTDTEQIYQNKDTEQIYQNKDTEQIYQNKDTEQIYQNKDNEQIYWSTTHKLHGANLPE